MLVGALGYVTAFLLYSLNKTSYGYWPMIFPGLCFAVIGADLEFNVTNASGLNPQSLPRLMNLLDVCNVVYAKVQTEHSKRYFPNAHSIESYNRHGLHHSHLR
jgi:hypothetical protein